MTGGFDGLVLRGADCYLSYHFSNQTGSPAVLYMGGEYPWEYTVPDGTAIEDRSMPVPMDSSASMLDDTNGILIAQLSWTNCGSAAPKPKAKISVKAKAVKKRSKLRVNVDPNQPTWNYKIKIQKKVRGKWRTKRITRTKGTADKRTINLGKGKYRVKVPNQHGMTGTKSGVVRLKR